MSTTSAQLLGKYDLRELLGRGRMTEVWKAYDTQLQRLVAIKILHADLQNDPDFMARFESESRIIASLYHSNIVQIHDFHISAEPERTSIYIVMDYIEGPTLAEYIHVTSYQQKFPSAADIVHLFTALSLAVDYAHQQGMRHLDIHPDNILLYRRAEKASPASESAVGEPILINLGIAKLLSTNTSVLGGSLLKTIPYVSPEQAKSNIGIESSDIYSLGVILYEISTGKPPFQGDSASAIMKQHINTLLPPPSLVNPMIPPTLEQVILRSLAKDPIERFRDASSMATAIADAFDIPVPESLSRPSSSPEITQNAITFAPAASSLSTVVVQSATTDGSVTPPGTTPVIHSVLDTPRIALSQTPMPTPTTLSIPVQQTQLPQRKRKGLFISLVVLAILVLGNVVLGVFSFVSHRGPVIASKTIVGSAFLISSGQLSDSNSQGINDEMQIDLHNIAAPASGKSYYAWLLNDRLSSIQTCMTGGTIQIINIPLGELPFDHGTVHYLYKDPTHRNLLRCTSRLLVTEENSNSIPSQPTKDVNALRFYAELPQQPDPNNVQNYSVLDELRFLLYEGGDLKGTFNLDGGLNIRLLRDTEQIWEWASSARDTWYGQNTDIGSRQFIQRQLIRILDYLDGKISIDSDLPPGTEVLVNPVNFQIALLQQSPGADSYITRIINALSTLTSALGTTPQMQTLSKGTINDIGNIQKWLQQVRTDAKRLFVLSQSDTQLSQLSQPGAKSILDTMQSLTSLAFIGQIDPSTGKVQRGVTQIYYNIEQLATFNISPY